MRYSRGIDRHDDELLASAYHSDSTDDHGEYIGGVDGFIAYANKLHETHWVSHQHYHLNQTIDLDGDTAHVETYFIIALRRKEGPVDMFGGRWVDRMERRSQRWGIVDRVVVVEWDGELPSQNTSADPTTFINARWDREDVSYVRPLKVTRPHRMPNI